ncbi:hypothetical protein RHSIM_Rhsim07G0147100 [Rhododendron simsii]|uniref:Reverse transcriptase domain-containing protein n=1 Tax=Rhododendron simsii TaxID=118357 RepID=A0A834LJW7_RHOSS|nr:hypothetical protein RHSIM_Rhsim07G0147100 [Rhododendron simsii]
MKVDIMKTYDNVRWDFLWDVLASVNFHPKMIQWLKACVSTANYSLCFNGEAIGYILGRKLVLLCHCWWLLYTAAGASYGHRSVQSELLPVVAMSLLYMLRMLREQRESLTEGFQAQVMAFSQFKTGLCNRVTYLVDTLEDQHLSVHDYGVFAGRKVKSHGSVPSSHQAQSFGEG